MARRRGATRHNVVRRSTTTRCDVAQHGGTCHMHWSGSGRARAARFPRAAAHAHARRRRDLLRPPKIRWRNPTCRNYSDYFEEHITHCRATGALTRETVHTEPKPKPNPEPPSPELAPKSVGLGLFRTRSAAQRRAVQSSAAQRNAAQCRAALCRAALCRAAQSRAVQRRAVQRRAVPCSAVRVHWRWRQ